MTKNKIQVIGRALDILRALEREKQGLSLSAIAERVRLPRSTVQRIVAALANENVLIAASNAGRFVLGPELARLAQSANTGLESVALPIMQELSSATQETVDLSILKGDTVMFIEHIAGTQRLAAVSAVGVSFPLHCTANGKAILSLMNSARRDQLLGNRLKRFTSATIIDHPTLASELAAIHDSGLAFDLEEHSVGIMAVGTSLLDSSGREFAISIPVPSSRFAAKRAQLCKLLRQARNTLLRELGQR